MGRDQKKLSLLAHLLAPLLACLLFKDLLDFLLHRFVDQVRRVMRWDGIMLVMVMSRVTKMYAVMIINKARLIYK